MTPNNTRKRLRTWRPAALSRAAAIFCAIAGTLLVGQANAERSRIERRAFVQENTCPVTGQHRGRCTGWEVDHVIPLCAGGQDKPSNMQWIRKEDHRFKTLVDVRECRRQRLIETCAVCRPAS